MRVEEEQVVAPARLSDGPAYGEAEVPVPGLGLRDVVLDIRPGIRVPVGVAFDVEERTVELVGAALGHTGYLQSA
jgi:hypothetical protein